jgi:hypothetical protein
MISIEATTPDAKAATPAQCAKQGETHIENMRERGDKAVRRFSSAFVRGISGTGR